MRIFSLLFLLCICCCLNSKAQEIVKSLTTGEYESINNYDIIPVNSFESKYVLTNPNNSISDINWSVRGDLRIISQNGATVTIASSPQNSNYKSGYGKGQLIVSYSDTTIPSNCGRPGRSVEIFKKFGQKERTNIIGNSCINTGDTVTYSIEPLVSVNLNARIGIDLYKWEVPNNWNVLFYSGDSSSITFKVGQLTGNDILKADIGMANFNDGFVYELPMAQGPATPTFSAAPPECLSLDDEQFTVSINAIEGEEYEWGFGPGTNWSFANGSTPNDPSITIKTDDRQGEVTLKIKGSCNQPLDTAFVINRSFGSNNEITGEECVEAGSYVKYTVSNSSTNVEWTLPEGWTYADANRNLSTVTLKVGNKGGTITAKSLNCGSDAISIDVSVQPKTPANISGPTCLEFDFNEEVTYSVPAVDNATGYQWTFPSTFTPNRLTTSTPTASTKANFFNGNKAVSVVALGCVNSKARSYTVTYAPETPVITGPSCLTDGDLRGSLTYSVKAQTGVSFNWSLPSGWTFVSNNTHLNSITVAPNGNADGTISVQAVGCKTTPASTMKVSTASDGGFEFKIVQPFGAGIYQITTTSGGYNFGNYDKITWYLNGNVLTTNTIIYAPGNCAEGELSVEIIDNTNCINTSTSIINQCSNGRSSLARTTNNLSTQEKIANKMQFKVSPNPVSNKLKIALPETSSQFTIRVIDLNGKVIMTEQTKNESTTLKLGGLNRGTYIILAEDGDQQYAEKIIKE
ncbi:T9SS type A sorting domain-containing protein [Fulvivirga sediminis]|uniref:T9SS type A sorting domain-containing protein n=1 Tax=Fulvivirga sediminis TaxID=2803949 RepID=A0A937F583_9BACT|nr:T9SS type A sorting domain-containing protein [Fulvivirga sediminis]MBL3655147.1 T9SS type A sorting domain-containing protein [Fulvivirga sediminis]